MKIHDLAPPR